MLYRKIPDGLIAISQPAHAWLAGQVALAWGNQVMGTFAPHQEVSLAAAQHDIGWLKWETRPTRDPHTGLPYSFLEMPRIDHIDIWTTAGRHALILGRYPALLISLHGTGLYERFGRNSTTPADQPIVQAWLEGEYRFQAELLASLQQDSYYTRYTTPEVIERNRRLIATWDSFSLSVCAGLQKPVMLEHVPAADGDLTLTLTPDATDSARIIVEPWSFTEDMVTLICEGRRIIGTYADEQQMHTALRQAAWVTMHTHLVPGR